MKQKNRSRRPILEHWQIIALYLMVYDTLVVNGSYLFALWIRFDCQFSQIREKYLTAWSQFIPIYTVVCLILFWGLRLYRSIWRFASFAESAVFSTKRIVQSFDRPVQKF